MPDQISNLLGAYLDGELDERSQVKVQAHLETCADCQAELNELRQLSQMLRAAPQPELTPAVNFRTQLMLQLPRQVPQTRAAVQTSRPKGLLLAWMAPVLVLAVWIFFQVSMGMSTLVTIANQAGFMEGAASRLATSTPQQLLWVTAAQATMGSVLGQQGQTSLNILNSAGLLAKGLTDMLLWQFVAAVLYWGALAVAWLGRNKMFKTTPTSG
ncbi:MAG: hypothetical protein HGA86_07760 [Anaerolineaceae bacterium]|nr:hypothetical protein [Anaerolineaceae bacterium]